MKKILVVDDDQDTCELLEIALSKEGYKVSKAYSGEEALDMLKELLPDLILLDIVLPGMDGIELCKKLKNESSFKDVPILVMSGYYDENRKSDSFDAGANDFIKKPFKIDELLLKVEDEL